MKWQLGVAVGVLAAFFVLGLVLILTADVADNVWKNRIAIFSSFEAIVFTAVGWLFGREVMRGKAEAAEEAAEKSEQREAKAKDDADDAKTAERQQTGARITAEQEAATERQRGTTLAAGIIAGGAPTASNGGGRASDVSARGSRTDLRELALHLYPELRR